MLALLYIKFSRNLLYRVRQKNLMIFKLTFWHRNFTFKF